MTIQSPSLVGDPEVTVFHDRTVTFDDSRLGASEQLPVDRFVVGQDTNRLQHRLMIRRATG